MRSPRWVTILGLALLLATPLLAAETGQESLSLAADGNVGKPNLKVLDQTSSGFVLSLEIPSLEVSDLELGDQSFRALSLPEGGHAGTVGQVALPVITQLVALPAGVGAKVNLVEQDVTDLGTMRLAPNQDIVDRDKVGPVSFDLAAYQATPISQVSASAGEPALMHGHRVVPVTFSPVAYDPATGATRVARRMVVEVSFDGRDTRNDAVAAPRMIPESFDILLRETVAGYERDADVAVGPGTYLVICPNNTTVINNLEPLLDWRRRQGFNVVLATTAQTGTTNTGIKAWLQQQYANLDPALEYVVLVGDANGSVAIPTWSESYSGYGGEGDHDYTLLSGGDVLADVHIGRLSVTSTTELANVVSKIVDYESDPDMSDTSWFTTAGLTGDPSSSGESCIWTNQFVKEHLLDLNYTQIDTIWSGSFLSQMMATINQGESIFTYRGYWGMSGMNSSHITALGNGRQLPFACILTCDTGTFRSDTTCRSEAFLRATNGGGIAGIGTATTGTHTRYNNCMFLGIMDHVLNAEQHRIGPALTAGKLNLYTNYNDNEWDRVWIWSTWNNLMGDPATEIFTAVPADLDVEYPDQVALGANALPVRVTSGGVAVAKARVALYQDGNLSQFAYTDASGDALLPLDGAANGDVKVTVTGTNLRPHLGAMAVGSVSRSLDFVSLELSEVSGNGDDVANPGETVDLEVTLRNSGLNTVSGAEAVLTTPDAAINLIDADASYGTVAPGASVTRSFRVSLDQDAEGGAVVPLRLDASAGVESWASLVNLTITGGHGTINRVRFDGPGSDMDPGETGGLTFDLANIGNLATGGVNGTLSCNSQWLTVTDDSGSWGAIGINGAVAQAEGFAISIAADCFPGHMATLHLELEFAEGGHQTVDVPVTIGTAVAGDPTGPDNYGYYVFSDDDDAPQAPTYDWVELAAIGTNTGISDNGGGDDETRSFDLPFDFTYYGETYDRVSICSNGWLSLRRVHDTQIKLYRNWTLPAAGSPSAMIAAFWDDLAQGTVYHHHDTANHRYIVQWDGFGTSTSSSHNSYSGNCTFEIILYDPAFHGTDSGDGLIEIQYQSVTITGDETTYFTVGLQNEARDDGVTYVYGNNYAGGAATIGTGRALAMVPVIPQAQGTLSGEVTNASDGGSAIDGAVVTVLGSGRQIASGADGFYAGGVPVGTWDVAVYHDSFAPDTTYNVTIAEDQTTDLDFALTDIRGPYIANATQLASTEDTAGPYVVQANITDYTGVEDYSLVYTSSQDGAPVVLPLTLVDAGTGLVRGEIPGQPNGTRVQYWLTATDVLGNGSAAPAGAPWPAYTFMVAAVTEVASDACESAGSWSVNPDGNDTATSGVWENGDPIGTDDGGPVQPEDDHTAAPGVNCWFTGQHQSGESAGYNDIDGGDTTLETPAYDVTGLDAITVSYWRWYTNDQGNAPGEDTWLVQVSGDGGSSWSTVESTMASNEAWQQVSFVVNDLVSSPSQLQLRFNASDTGSGSLVEAAVDDLSILASTSVLDQAAPTVSVQSPSGGTYSNGLNLHVGWTAGDDVGVVHAQVWLSLDGGATYDMLLGEGPLDGELDWLVNVPAGPPSYDARVRVDVFDGQERVASDESAAFTIDPGITGVDELPTAVALSQNHPNPFNPATVISFSLPASSDVRLHVYDLQGKLVRTLVDERVEAGVHEITWRGQNDDGGKVASGVYFYRLSTRDGDHVRKMTLLK